MPPMLPQPQQPAESPSHSPEVAKNAPPTHQQKEHSVGPEWIADAYSEASPGRHDMRAGITTGSHGGSKWETLPREEKTHIRNRPVRTRTRSGSHRHRESEYEKGGRGREAHSSWSAYRTWRRQPRRSSWTTRSRGRGSKSRSKSVRRFGWPKEARTFAGGYPGSGGSIGAANRKGEQVADSGGNPQSFQAKEASTRGSQE